MLRRPPRLKRADTLPSTPLYRSDRGHTQRGLDRDVHTCGAPAVPRLEHRCPRRRAVERDCRVLDRPAFGAAQLHPEQLHADTSEKSGWSQGDAKTGSGSLGATPNATVNATMPSTLPAAFALLSCRRSEEPTSKVQ